MLSAKNLKRRQASMFSAQLRRTHCTYRVKFHELTTYHLLLKRAYLRSYKQDHVAPQWNMSGRHPHSSFLAASWASLRRMPATPAPCNLMLGTGLSLDTTGDGSGLSSEFWSCSCSLSQCTACSGPVHKHQCISWLNDLRVKVDACLALDLSTNSMH